MSALDKVPPTGENTSCKSDAECLLNPATGEKLVQDNPEIKIENGWGGKRIGAGRKPNPPHRLIQRATGPRWYVFEMMRGQEDRIVRELLIGEDRRGLVRRRPPFEVCQPRIVVEVVRKGQRLAVHQNMFAGYSFLRLDAVSEPWPLIREVEGVLRIFTTKSINPDTGNVTPIPLPVGFVEQLIDTAAQRLSFAAVRLPSYAAGQALRVESAIRRASGRVPVVRWTDHAGFGASVRA